MICCSNWKKRADINLHIIGKGPYMERLQKLKNKNTVIHGYVSAQEKIMLLAPHEPAKIHYSEFFVVKTAIIAEFNIVIWNFSYI